MKITWLADTQKAIADVADAATMEVVIELLSDGIIMRMKAAKMHDDADGVESEANVKLKMGMDIIGVKDVYCDKGSVSRYLGKSTRTEWTGIMEKLVAQYGVSLEVMEELKKEFTKTKEHEEETVKWTVKKEKKAGKG